MSLSYKEVTQAFSQEFQQINQIIDHECNASNSKLLKALLHHCFQVRGKMLRPLFTLACANSIGLSSRLEDILHIASGLEVLHTASLVHDDIIDNGELRRGQATINAKWGIAEATLLGDWLLAKSFELMTRTQNLKVIHNMTLLTGELTEGQFLESEINRESDYPQEIYLKMIDLKTSSMFRFAGAFVGYIKESDDSELVAQLMKLGTCFGNAFQIVDDLIDLLQDESEALKTTQIDILNGIRTLPILIALDREEAQGKSHLKDCLQKKNFETLGTSLFGYLCELSAIEASYQLASQYISECRQIIDSMSACKGTHTLKLLCQLTLQQVNSKIHRNLHLVEST